jgi:hypothetical protein
MQPPIQQGGQQAAGSLRSAGTQIRTQGQTASQGVQSAGTNLSNSINVAANQVRTSAATGGGGVGFLGFLGGLLGLANGGLVGDIQSLRRYAEGGRITGRGTGTSDDILAWLSNGEYVVRSAMTRQFLPFLEAMNNGASKEDMARMFMADSAGGDSELRRMLKSAPGFSTGGPVGDILGTPNITEPRLVTIAPGTSAGDTNISTDARRMNSTTILNISYNVSGGNGQPTDTMRRSLNQHAKMLAAQIEKAKKNT